MPEPTFNEVLQRNPTVHALSRRGASLESIIVALHLQITDLQKEVFQLQSIAPKRINVGGKSYIYHCPDHLVPETTIPDPTLPAASTQGSADPLTGLGLRDL